MKPDMATRRDPRKLVNITMAELGRRRASGIAIQKPPGRKRLANATAHEKKTRNKVWEAVEALMGMGPMQERLTRAGAALVALSPDEFPDGTRALFAHIVAHLDLNEDSQCITNAQSEDLSWKIRELHRRVYSRNHPVWKSDE